MSFKKKKVYPSIFCILCVHIQICGIESRLGVSIEVWVVLVANLVTTKSDTTWPNCSTTWLGPMRLLRVHATRKEWVQYDSAESIHTLIEPCLHTSIRILQCLDSRPGSFMNAKKRKRDNDDIQNNNNKVDNDGVSIVFFSWVPNLECPTLWISCWIEFYIWFSLLFFLLVRNLPSFAC